MKKLTTDDKKRVVAGLSFWSLAMGISLLVQVITTAALSITSAVMSANAETEDKQAYANNSWANSYNRYGSFGSSMRIKIGLSPAQSAVYY